MDQQLDCLVCVVVYDRKGTIDKWLRAWNNAEHYGTKIAVIHNYDGDKLPEDQTENILKHKPDFYVPRKNEKRDIGALRDVVAGKLALPEWKYICWFTDDMLPMRRTFLRPFVEKIAEPNVGLVAQCYEPKNVDNGMGGHIRTTAFALKREAAVRLVWPSSNDPGHFGHQFEHHQNHVLEQVRNMGYEFKLAHGGDPESDNYQHWTSFLDWMWDSSLLGKWKEYWQVYEDQFKPHQIREDLKVHPHMLLDLAECERQTTIPGKITAIMATCQAPIEFLAWSMFSLLCRSTPGGCLEHVMVHVNGPDKRTGDPSLQDKKQAFLEELRNMKWGDRDMPITIQRTWSRIGHAHALEGCIPWVHTEAYLLVHDDIVVMKNGWEADCESFFQDLEAIVLTSPLYRIVGFGVPLSGQVQVPHLNSVFILCRKNLMTQLGARWWGYDVRTKFHIGNLANYGKLVDFHSRHKNIDEKLEIPNEEDEYGCLSMDIGSWVYYKISVSDYKMMFWKDDFIHHFVKASWGENRAEWIFDNIPACVLELENYMKQNYPKYFELYSRYVTPRISVS